MTNAQLCNDGIYGSDLYPGSPALVAKLGRVDVILAIGEDKWQGGKPLSDLLVSLWSCEPLQ